MSEEFSWNDKNRQQAVDLYLQMEPTPENTVECVNEVAETLGTTVNSVRMILMRAEVYVNKAAPEKKKSGGTRVNKQQALDDLRSAIADVGQEVDDSIIDKLTGKAAVYLTGVIRQSTLEE